MIFDEYNLLEKDKVHEIPKFLSSSVHREVKIVKRISRAFRFHRVLIVFNLAFALNTSNFISDWFPSVLHSILLLRFTQAV